MGIKQRLAAAWFPGPLEALAWRGRPVPRAIMLMYHEVLPDDVDLPSWLVLRASAFERQMRHLQQYFSLVSIDEALARLRNRPAESKRPLAVVSFDDGYFGNYSTALPILRRLGIPFTIYIATQAVSLGSRYWYDDVICALLESGSSGMKVSTSAGPIYYTAARRAGPRRWAAINEVLTAIKKLPAEERQAIAQQLGTSNARAELRMMTPTEIRRLVSEPLVTIGNHTHTHELLDQVSIDVARAVIGEAQSLLAGWTGVEPRHFCYPNGNYTPETAKLVQELGFASAVTTKSRPWLATDPVYEIPRVGIGRFDNLNVFRAKVSGLLS